MADGVALERLQPSLFDRLDDGLGRAVAAMGSARSRLKPQLDAAQDAALAELLARERLDVSVALRDLPEPLRRLDDDDRAVLAELLAAETGRRFEMRRSIILDMRHLRAAVLRDLGHLLNTSWAQDLPQDRGGDSAPVFAGLPHAAASVVNYGIPTLAGRVRTPADYATLAAAVEEAIERFEPRLRDVRVSVDADPGAATVKSPVTLIIEGELWGYPVAEGFLAHTLLDLEEGLARVEPAGAG